jgi:hypothetical protein
MTLSLTGLEHGGDCQEGGKVGRKKCEGISMGFKFCLFHLVIINLLHVCIILFPYV